MKKPDFNQSLKIILVHFQEKTPEEVLEPIKLLFREDDEISVIFQENFSEDCVADLLVFKDLCGPTPLAPIAAKTKIPILTIEPYHGYHPYQAAFQREVEDCGGILLPTYFPEEISASIQAVRAKKGLTGLKLIVASAPKKNYGQQKLQTFISRCQEQLGVEIISKSTDEVKELATKFSDQQAEEELQRWENDILDGPGEKDPDHMRQVAKLYLAERQMLEETGAIGITVEDIGGFFCIPEPVIMPNVTYGILAHDGYLACEEADIEALTTELLLYAGTGVPATMSNIYYAYRDQFDKLNGQENYTHEMELADTRQSFEDNRITAAHFSGSGILPPNMMEEERYRVRDTKPTWDGQSMIVSTPKLGKVVVSRLSEDCSAIHTVPGEADRLGLGDKYGWYRGRWFIKIPSTQEFADKCLHQHYAIGQDTGNLQILEILTGKLLGLKLF